MLIIMIVIPPFHRIPLTPAVTSTLPASTQPSPEEIRARTENYAAVVGASHQDEVTKETLITTTVLLPTLDIVLKTLALVVAIKVAPTVISALRGSR